MYNDGYNTVIINGYNNGGLNSNVCGNLQNAYSYKIYYRELLIEPKPDSSKSAADQINELLDYVNANCLDSGNSTWGPTQRLWMLIETTSGWS